jgi:hypothetical protein
MRRDVLNSKVTQPRPIGLDSRTWKSVEPVFAALQQFLRQTGRDRFYGYLTEVYRAYKKWKGRGISKRMARQLAKELELPKRKGTSAIRTLIDATFPGLGMKQKSRWSRALEFAALSDVKADDLPARFKSLSGIAGFARSAAKRRPKKDMKRNDWI